MTKIAPPKASEIRPDCDIFRMTCKLIQWLVIYRLHTILLVLPIQTLDSIVLGPYQQSESLPRGFTIFGKDNEKFKVFVVGSVLIKNNSVPFSSKKCDKHNYLF